MRRTLYLRQHYRGLNLSPSVELNNRERAPNIYREEISDTQQENSIKE
jgi:hypothetical protein